MKAMNPFLPVSEEEIAARIFWIRQHRVMLDRDLAILFETKTIRLREQVKRNLDRFPENFMFALSDEEIADLSQQGVFTTVQQLGGSRPLVFTEHGVLQLANVLRSERAAEMSVRIIEVFVKLRSLLSDHRELLYRMEGAENKLNIHDGALEELFQLIRQLLHVPAPERKAIGYRAG
jgi:hypothetical protein